MTKKPSSASSHFSERYIAYAWLGMVFLFLAMLSFQWLNSSHSPLETNILKLLPSNQQNPVAEQAFESVSNDLSDKVIFVVSSDSTDNTYKAANSLTHSLKALGIFDEVVGKIAQDQQNAWANYYFSHRFQQLTPQQRERLSNQPSAQIQYVVQSVYNPFSGVTGRELSEDPFLIFRDYLAQLSKLNSAFTIKNDFLSTQYQGRDYVLVTATLDGSPYSLSAQQGVPEIIRIENTLAERYKANIYHTGVLFFAEFGTQSAKSEISTIGLFSLLGIIVLIIGVFRSLAPLGLALLSITVGVLAALAVTTWVFGHVHLFSLVFGASLIGVSIDYSFHFLTERLAAGKSWAGSKGLKKIFPAITMGLITSLIGYIGMLIAPFPGLQQLALFSSVGLIAAYFTVVAWYPILAAKPVADIPLPGQKLWNSWLNLWSKTPIRRTVPIVFIVLAIPVLVTLHYNDDIRQMQAMPESLKQQESFISNLSGLESSQQMLVVTAKDDESLLQHLEKLNNQLDKWVQKGTISGYQSLSQYIGSKQQQNRDYQMIEQLYSSQGKLLANTLGLSRSPKLEFPFREITLQEFLSQPVSEPIRFLYVNTINDKVAGVIALKGVSQSEPIQAYAEASNDLSYLDKAQEISDLFSQYRVKVMELLLCALSVIAIVLIKRYGVSHALKILLPSLIACLVALACAQVVNSNLNLFNLLALILIIGIGIDYTLFFAEKAHSPSTLLAITLSAVTTLLSFGLLSLSQTHAIHSFGITVLSGIFVAWLLSPLAINRDKT